MNESIFDFWKRMPEGATRHPGDTEVFDRASTRFEENGLPSPFMGPLLTAPIVLLFLSPGFDEGAGVHAASEDGRMWYRNQRDGKGLLPSQKENEPGWRWWIRTVRQFDIETETARSKVAFLDISAYPSVSFFDWPMLCALPSSRVALDWAQSVLFPEAIAGNRVVVCLRSAPYWGLGKKARYGEGLFSPATNRRGHMLHEGENPLAIRKTVIGAVQAKLAEQNAK